MILLSTCCYHMLLVLLLFLLITLYISTEKMAAHPESGSGPGSSSLFMVDLSLYEQRPVTTSVVIQRCAELMKMKVKNQSLRFCWLMMKMVMMMKVMMMMEVMKVKNQSGLSGCLFVCLFIDSSSLHAERGNSKTCTATCATESSAHTEQVSEHTWTFSVLRGFTIIDRKVTSLHVVTLHCKTRR